MSNPQGLKEIQKPEWDKEVLRNREIWPLRRRMCFQEIPRWGQGCSTHSFPQLPKLSQSTGRCCLFAFKNSEIVDFSLWFRNGNRRMKQATVVWEDQGRRQTRKQFHRWAPTIQRPRHSEALVRSTPAGACGGCCPEQGWLGWPQDSFRGGCNYWTVSQRTHIYGRVTNMLQLRFCVIFRWKSLLIWFLTLKTKDNDGLLCLSFFIQYGE